VVKPPKHPAITIVASLGTACSIYFLLVEAYEWTIIWGMSTVLYILMRG
jgi:hypothetical protein